MLIGQTVKSYREKNGLSIRQLANRIGVVPSTLYRFENDRTLGDKNWIKIFIWLLREKNINPK